VIAGKSLKQRPIHLLTRILNLGHKPPLAPYDQAYIEAIFIGMNIKYGNEIPGFDLDEED